MVPVGKIHHILCQIFARKGRNPELCISYAAFIRRICMARDSVKCFSIWTS